METFVVFDLETSGRYPTTAEIIEIAALKAKGHEIVEEFSTFVKPKRAIDPESTAINGITNAMVADAPSLTEALTAFRDFIQDYVLVGYNIASFDLPILRRVFQSELRVSIENEYVDVLRLARQELTFLPDRKLTTVAAYFGIDTTGAHRALNDCYITLECFRKLEDMTVGDCGPRSAKPAQAQKRKHHPQFSKETKALQTLQGFLMGVIADNILTEPEVLALKGWLDENRSLAGQYPFDRVFDVVEKALADGLLEQEELDEMLGLFRKFTSPTDECADSADEFELSGKTVCLTGDFEYCSRSSMETLLSSYGCICKNTVSGKTDYVIVGALGSPEWSHGTYGSKIKKALEYQEKGKNVQIVKEERLMEVLQEKGLIP